MANVVGSWVYTSDWGCDGSITGSWNQTFNADGTWSSSLGHSGRWFQVEGMVAFTLTDTPNLVYTANLSGSWMAGIQGYVTAGGSKGCHGAHRSGVTATPAKAAAKKGPDPVLGR
jgi:hypothetical protein